MKLLAIFSILSATAVAESVLKCGSCDQATSSDCIAAFNKMPTSGTLSDNEQEYWTSGDCTVRWFTGGNTVDAPAAHGVTQSLVNKCCTGDSCSGISYDTGSTDILQGGCICVHEAGKTPCQCISTPTLAC